MKLDHKCSQAPSPDCLSNSSYYQTGASCGGAWRHNFSFFQRTI